MLPYKLYDKFISFIGFNIDNSTNEKLYKMKNILQYEFMSKPTSITYFDDEYNVIENVHNKGELFEYIEQLVTNKYLNAIYMYDNIFMFIIPPTSDINLHMISFDPFNKNHNYTSNHIKYYDDN
jgi:hypothetical protein